MLGSSGESLCAAIKCSNAAAPLCSFALRACIYVKGGGDVKGWKEGRVGACTQCTTAVHGARMDKPCRHVEKASAGEAVEDGRGRESGRRWKVRG
mmetsp:Transcript_28580/g.72840  ORF Transcript_28580/g.72840 Transcript_28580/m.72840 type:complete len:95 (+) Transcript_28580:879-1163(+)